MRDRVISTKFLTHRVSLQSSHPNFQTIFAKIFRKNFSQNIEMLISRKTVLDRVVSTKFLTHRVSLQSSLYLCRVVCRVVSPRMAAILNFLFFCKKCKSAYISKTMLDRADYADFGCHNSIRLEAEHFLNTLSTHLNILFGMLCFCCAKSFFFWQAIL